MNGIPTMSPIFGVFFTLVGFALAVLLGIALYPDKKKQKSSFKKPLDVHEEVKTVSSSTWLLCFSNNGFCLFDRQGWIAGERSVPQPRASINSKQEPQRSVHLPFFPCRRFSPVPSHAIPQPIDPEFGKMSLLVLTDMEVVMLDHCAYSCDAAKAALDLLRSQQEPLFLAPARHG